MLDVVTHSCPMEIGKRIKAAREARGLSQEELGEAIGRQQTTVSSWERGRTEPSRADVVRIASKLRIPIHEIEDALRSEQVSREIAEVPLLSWVSAGQVSDVGSLDAASAEEVLAVADLPAGEWFATRVRGDSMDRVSPEGSRIFVNIADKRLTPGKAYVFSLRGETTFKIYHAEPVKRLEPFSTNPANRTIFLTEEGWSVIGRVWRSYIDLT